MGYDLSATLGYGVKLKSFESSDGLLDNSDKDYEDLDNEDFRIEFAGTDDCTEVFLLVKDSIIEADWYGYAVDLEKLHTYSNTKITLRNYLDDNGIETTLENYKWWLLPRWF